MPPDATLDGLLGAPPARLIAALPASVRPTDRERLVAIAWATVDLARTLEGLEASSGVASSEVAARDVVLGGRASVLGRAGPAIVVIEPDSEGRIAAYLARHGEGIGAVYVAVAARDGRPDVARRPSDRSVHAAVGPTALGVDGRLRAPAGRWGPFVIELDAADGP